MKLRFGGPKIGKKCRFDTFFGRFFRFSEVTKCYKLQHFCVLTSLAGAMHKRRKCCKYPYFFGPEMHKTLQIPVFLKAKQKNTVNYSIFGVLIAKNAGVHSVFAISRKRGRHETL